MAETEKESLKIAKEGRVSYNALSTLGGMIAEECNRDLVFPYCVYTYKKMFKDATIAPALSIMEMSISKVPWTVKIPKGKKEELKDKAEFLEQVMNDMDSTWSEFIRKASTINKFGFAPIEKVYRKRLRKEGSKYNDGKYGIKDLHLIAQDSVLGWEWSDDGRDLIGLRQAVVIPKGKNGDISKQSSGEVFIPRNKFLLFNTGADKDNPQGLSPLNAVYMAWRFKTELEKAEAKGVANDLRGLKVISIPPEYLAEDATEDQKATRKYFEEALKGISRGEQEGVIMPLAYNESSQKMFDFELKSVIGSNAHDTNAIIERYKKEILTGIMIPHLVLGQDGGGSFALSDNIKEVANTVIQARLREIRDQLNHDLIPQLFRINGWDTEVTPYFDFEEDESSDWDEFSKAVQRIAAVGGIVLDAPTVNSIAKKLSLPIPFDDEDISLEEVEKYTTAKTTRSGDGMEVGKVGEGTSDVLSGEDKSISNMENA